MMRLFLILVSAAFLTACGFTPMHSEAGGGGAFNKVSIDLVDGKDLGDDQAGFYVMQRMRDRIGTNDAAPHKLVLRPDVRRRRIGVTDQDVASRYDTSLLVNYVLSDKKTGKVLDAGRISSVTTFGAPLDSYGVVASDISSKQQAAKEISDRLLNTLARYYANNPTP